MKERMDRMLIQLRETEDELNETLKNYMTLFDGKGTFKYVTTFRPILDPHTMGQKVVFCEFNPLVNF
jgi:hypothetical protein